MFRLDPRRCAVIAGIASMLVAPAAGRAEDPPVPVTPATPPVEPPPPPADAAAVQALADQVRALQQRLDAVTAAHQPPAPVAAPTTAPEQSPTPNRAVNAKEAGAAPRLAGPPPLSWNGVTLYGTVDVGVAHLSHGAPLSPSYGPSLPFVLQAFSNRPITSLTNNGLSQSKLGLSGVEPLHLADLKALFKLETGFQPTSGRLTDGPRSLLDNNGLPNNQRVTAGDSGRAGQVFQGAAYVGLGSDTFGTLTIGRHQSLMADGLLKYDPQLQSQAFSPIGYSGTSGGFGDTEDKQLDDAIKYAFAYGPGHAAGLYQLGRKGARSIGSASFDLGADYAGLSVDFVWGLVRDAIMAASLNAMQAAAAPGTLAATVSDNTGFAAMASYTISPVKLYAGYEHMRYTNPDDALANGTVTIGGYVLSAINNAAY
ncbi:MAG TPA: porin, partial [Kofleriaceae bacterium]